MIEKINEMFAQLDLPYYRQGSFVEGDSIPESFYTFWNTDTPDKMYYDNEARRTDWVYDIYYYTRSPDTLYSGMNDLIAAAKNIGFVINGKGKDVASSIPEVFCRMIRIKYIQIL